MMLSQFRRKGRPPRVLVLGLDCASPQIIFDELRGELPTFRRLMDGGTWGELESSIPCITVPAWSSMLSSRDPGVLGCYGFRNRADYSYNDLRTADSTSIQVPRLWDILSALGKNSLVMSVPQTYPVRPINGSLVSCFLTPNTNTVFTYPAILKQEILRLAPHYAFDARDFRTADKQRLLRDLHDLTEIQFSVFQHLLKTKPWDFAMYVNIGLDRLHHGFWRFHDPQHRLHDPNSPLRDVIRDYYRLMDANTARLIEIAGDDAIILVVSDHGVKRMDGGVCINEWLWQNGWLALKTPPADGKLTRIEDADIDWTRTRAWAAGGYYGRIFLNIQEREPAGTIPHQSAREVRELLAQQIAAITGENGQSLVTTVYRPEAIYQDVRGIPPDLLVYFGDLHWRAVGSLGHGKTLTRENDTGPDDANHATQGLFILHDPHARGAGRYVGAQLMDIAPTLLQRMGVRVPTEMQGRVIQ